MLGDGSLMCQVWAVLIASLVGSIVRWSIGWPSSDSLLILQTCSQGVVKGDQSIKNANRRLEHPACGTLYGTFGTKATYFCFHDINTGKKSLFVAVSETQASDHLSACVDLVKQSCERSLDKKQTLLLRAKILKQYQK